MAQTPSKPSAGRLVDVLAGGHAVRGSDHLSDVDTVHVMGSLVILARRRGAFIP